MKPKTKIDLYKQHKADYAATRKPALVTLKPAKYLAIEGEGRPGGDVFAASIGALYGVAFTIKMTRKFAGEQDYAVCKLEGQWWTDGKACFSAASPDKWRWKLLIRTPDFIGRDDIERAVAVLLKRGKPADVKRVGVETLDEGVCVQMLHVGPYDQEPKTVALMLAFAEQKELQLAGRHHEVYLSDPRRVAPDRLKTILRIPVRA
jgi:hypothetical protein